MAGIKFTVDEKELKTKMLRTVVSQINAGLSNAAMDIQREIKTMITSLLTGSPTYQSLLTAELRGDFGLANPEVPLADILNTIHKGLIVMTVPVQIKGETANGSINIKMIRDDFQDLLSLSSVKYMSKTFEVDWLDWLLKQGDTILVSGYHVKTGLSAAERKYSRSGIAIMELGGGWKVPSQFSGVLEDNWLTRIFNKDAIGTEVMRIVRAAIERRF